MAEADQDNIASLKSAAKQLADRLISDAGFANHVESVLDSQLANGLSITTYSSLGQHLEEFVGTDAADLLLQVLALGDLRAAIDEIGLLDGITSGATVREFFQFMRAKYGDAVKAATAFDRAGHTDEWSQLTWSMALDPTRAAWTVKVEIKKLDGEAMIIVGPPDDFLVLVTNIVDYLTKLPADAMFSDEANDAFEQKVVDFKKRASAVPSSTTAAATAVVAAAGAA